jgi:hypothetical protein
MSNPKHIYAARPIIDGEYDAIISDTDPPKVRITSELLASGRPRVIGEPQNLSIDSVKQRAG